MRAGDSVTLQQHLRVADPAAGEAASEAGAPSGHKARGSFTRFRLNLAMQELTGPLLRSRGLRYKKKMWSFRTASEPVPAALAAPGGHGSGGQGHVAYCMMTFIIRNGIKQLKESEAVYEGYVDALVRRWGLPAEQCRRVKEFGRSWARWACVNGHVKSLKESLYLDTAEVFVREFLGDQPSSSSSLRRAGSGGSRGTTPRGAARGAGSGKRGHRRASRGSRGSSGNLGDGGTGGSGSGQSGGRDGRPDSNSCSDSSLTALAGHCPLRRSGGYRGLALLVGFTERDVQEVARRVGAAAGAAAALEQGWVASLEQVPAASDKTFWDSATHCMKIVVRSSKRGTCSRADEPSLADRSSAKAEDDKGSITDAWQLPETMSGEVAGKVIQPYFLDGMARFGDGWLQARWLNVYDHPATMRKDATPSSSVASVVSVRESNPGKEDGSSLRKKKARRAKRASGPNTAAPVDVQHVHTEAGQSFEKAHDTDELAPVVAWLGSGISRTGEAARLASSGGSSANDPCLVVAFVSTPGLGKTSICEALQQHLDPARYHVVHHHSDALAMPQRKRFWPYVNTLALTRRGDGRATIVLADKNLLDSPPGNWEKTAAQINAPVLAVLLTDAASAAPLASHETLSPGAGGTDPAAQTAAPSAPRSADAAAAAVALAEEGLGKLDMNSSGTGRAAWKVGTGDGPAGQVGAGPARVPPGVNAPFSMEQYALAMLRVASRPDHVGQLDSRQPEALRIMCGFGSTFRRRSAPDVFRTLTATFHHAHALPVCLAESRAPPPPPGKHRALMDLVCEGFRKGRFGKGPSGYGVPPDWEERARALLRDDDVARFLYGFAMPLDDIAADLATAIDRTLATEAQGWAGADPTATALEPRSTPVTAEPQAAEAALERCVYVAVRGFSRGAVADAFAQVQERADGGGGATHVAKDELHITLWHAADGGQRRGLACVAAEGTPVRFTVTGFDVTPGLSAARVVFAPGAEAGTTGAPGVGALAGDVLAVELPHITMHVGRGEKAVNARWLQQRHARGEASVQWLPLQEPLLLTGKIHVVYK